MLRAKLRADFGGKRSAIAQQLAVSKLGIGKIMKARGQEDGQEDKANG